jgi:hypothetical protein
MLDVIFKKRMLELLEDGYIVFSKFGRRRDTEKGLACLIACAERPVKINAPTSAIESAVPHPVRADMVLRLRRPTY